MTASLRSHALGLPLSRRTVRVVLGTFWLVAAGYQALPHCFTASWWRTDAAQSAMGEPAVIRHSILWAVAVVAAHPVVWNALFVVIQAGLGLALVTGRAEKAAIVASVPWALGVWWVGEGFGSLPTGFALFGAGAPGPVVLYPIIGMLAWPQTRPARGGPEGHIAAKAGKALWLALWCGLAPLLVPWRFPSGQVIGANIEESSAGPSWMSALTGHAERFASAHGPVLAWSFAALSVMVGISVCSRRWRSLGLMAGIGVLTVFWIVFQGAGGLITGDATDVGTTPLVVLLALALWSAVPRLRPQPSDVNRRRMVGGASAVLAHG